MKTLYVGSRYTNTPRNAIFVMNRPIQDNVRQGPEVADPLSYIYSMAEAFKTLMDQDLQRNMDESTSNQ